MIGLPGDVEIPNTVYIGTPSKLKPNALLKLLPDGQSK